MNVLVACECSQKVAAAFRARGHNAFSCDIVPCYGGHPEWHILEDVTRLLNGCCTFRTMDGELHCVYYRWDLIIAFPPCTYLTKAGARWMYKSAGVVDPRRYVKMVAARDFFFRVMSANCERIAIENPRPLRIAELPTPSQVIQPYMFGHPYSKTTCLWLKNLPLLKPTDLLEDHLPFLPSNTSRFSKGGGGSKGVCSHSAVARSETFSGVAAAMAEQWG